MLRVAFSLLLFLLFAPSLLGQTVLDNNLVEINTTLTNSATTFALWTDAAAGNSESSPHDIFIPLATDGTVTPDNNDYSYYANRANLPELTGEVSAATLNFVLNIDVEGTVDHLHVAIGSGTEYEIVKVNSQTVDVNPLTLQVSLTEICSGARNSILDCSQLAKDSSPSSRLDIFAYIFLATGDQGTSTVIDPSNFAGGTYYRLNLSNRVFSTELFLNDLLKGDKQLIADFLGFTVTPYRGLFANISDGVAGLCNSVTDPSRNKTLGNLSLSLNNLLDLEFTGNAGEAKLRDLQNNFCYSVRLFQCDKFGFCSTSSEQIQNSPEEIEALLKKQACFFFTAGFERQHYIVDYFQAFRDQVLRRTWLGRQFVSFYYKVAPGYTPFILERPWLQKLIQGIAYLLYGVMKGGWLILFVFIAATLQWRRSKALPDIPSLPKEE